MPGLLRAIWRELPVLHDERVDLRTLDHLDEPTFRALAAEALEHYVRNPTDCLSAELLRHASYQTREVFHDRVAD